MIEAVLAALLKLGAPVDVAPEVAEAVAQFARSPQEAAFVLAWAKHESAYQRRIADDDCHRWECDHGRARGLWQSHQQAAGTAWAHLAGNISLQAFVAVKHARWALKTCSSAESPIRGAFAVLGGKGCDGTFRGIDQRVADYQATLTRIQ